MVTTLTIWYVSQSNKTSTSEQTHEPAQRSAFNEHSSCLKTRGSANLLQYLLAPVQIQSFWIRFFSYLYREQISLPRTTLFILKFGLILTYFSQCFKDKSLFWFYFWNQGIESSVLSHCFIIKYNTYFFKWNIPSKFTKSKWNKRIFQEHIGYFAHEGIWNLVLCVFLLRGRNMYLVFWLQMSALIRK